MLLLDEPLSNLDPALRERTRRELRALVHRLGITAIVVTHEQEDAFDLGDRIALLRQGRLEQLGTADELYATPATAFVAGVHRARQRASRARGAWQRPRDVDRVVRLAGPLGWTAGARCRGRRGRLLARPEGLRLAEPSPSRLTGDVTGRRFTGAVAYFSVDTASGATIEVAADPAAAREGDTVGHRAARARACTSIPAAAMTRARRAGWWGWLLAAGARLAGGVSARAGADRGGPRARRLDARRGAALCRRSTEWQALWAQPLALRGQRGRWPALIGVPLAFLVRASGFSRAATARRRWWRCPRCCRRWSGCWRSCSCTARPASPARLVQSFFGLAGPTVAAGRARRPILLVHAYSMYVYFYLFTRAALSRPRRRHARGGRPRSAPGAGGRSRHVILPQLRPALGGRGAPDLHDLARVVQRARTSSAAVTAS